MSFVTGLNLTAAVLNFCMFLATGSMTALCLGIGSSAIAVLCAAEGY